MITSDTACLLLHFLPQMGPIRAQRLLRQFPVAEKIFEADSKSLLQVRGMGLKQIEILQQWDDFLPQVIEEERLMAQEEIQMLSAVHPNYPKRLLQCPDAPVVLFYRGNCAFDNKRVVSVVGTRNPSPQGREATQKLLEQLAPFQPTLVSGFAYGIDIAVHRLALERNLPIIACLAHGLNRMYPEAHQAYIPQTLKQGGFVSDFSCQATFDRFNFFQRNRIIAGLADLTIVIESDLRGGSMNTAQYAWEYDRDLWVVPGRLGDAKSRGCLHLAASNKAQLICDWDSFIGQLGWDETTPPHTGVQHQLPLDLNAQENRVWEALKSQGKTHLDALALNLRMEIRQLSSVLFQLEMKSCIRALPGKFFEAL